MRLIILLLLVAATATPAFANAPPASDAASTFAAENYLTSREFIISVMVLAFGLLMAAAGIYMKRATEMESNDIIRFMALIIVVIGTLFLVASGYSAVDIAPALGLLGTIAGYLLGRSSKSGEGRE
ncbi:MAG: hypothetical protein A4S12_07755 [Proteobacteria bacterium SG_bin5]|nr:hypothetical protein [Sphingomonas sp.]OQW41762.1 MAG: hypothetical protein A4S12_07755 [Proteobacteria bacterium SG_bin5]